MSYNDRETTPLQWHCGETEHPIPHQPHQASLYTISCGKLSPHVTQLQIEQTMRVLICLYLVLFFKWWAQSSIFHISSGTDSASKAADIFFSPHSLTWMLMRRGWPQNQAVPSSVSVCCMCLFVCNSAIGFVNLLYYRCMYSSVNFFLCCISLSITVLTVTPTHEIEYDYCT